MRYITEARAQSQTRKQEQAAIEFALLHARPSDRIVASAALLYGFGFDPRLRDDPELGTISGNVPDIVIVDPIYRDQYASSSLADRSVWKVISAANMPRINKQLST